MTAAGDREVTPGPDLHTALEAAITERLEVARAAKVDGDGTWHLGSPAGWLIEDDAGEPVVHDEGSPIEEQAAHIAMNDPAQIIRDCDYHLKVIRRHTPFEQRNWSMARGSFTEPGCEHCQLTSNDGDPLARDWPCDEVTDLLDVYPEVTR